MSVAGARLDVGEAPDPTTWKGLPTEDRLLVGGRTVWLGPYAEPLIVCQPNRWGVVETEFPDIPCLVEIDPVVAGELPMPTEIVGWLDRAHEPLAAPVATATGREAMSRAARLANKLNSIRGVSVLTTGFARTIPLATGLEAAHLIEQSHQRGLQGIRPLPGTAGGFAITVDPLHSDPDLDFIESTLRSIVDPENDTGASARQ